jgi:MFS family permease
MLAWTVGYAVAFLLPLAAGLALRRPGRVRAAVAAAAFVVMGAMLRMLVFRMDDPLRPLPLILIALGAVSFAGLLRERKEFLSDSRRVLRASIIVFAFVLMGKMILSVRVQGSGFVLAMPATLVLIAALLSWVPAGIVRFGGWGGAFRAAGLAALLVLAIGFMEEESYWFARKTFPISKGADRIYADNKTALGECIEQARVHIERHVRPGQTLVSFPEGVMLNFLSRRANPTPYVSFHPVEVIVYGERNMLEALRSRPPDFVALVNREFTYFDLQIFGRDYGKRLHAWVQKNYRRFVFIGYPPLRERRSCILLMKRIPQP